MKQLVACAFAILGCCAPAVAQETSPWGSGEVNGWFVGIDHTIGNGCFIYTTFEGDAAARIGFDPGSQGFYFLIGDNDWQSMEDGKEYDVVMQMGERPEWTAIAVGSRLDDWPALLVVFDDANFIAEFAGQNFISMWLGRQEIATLSLDGSARAIDAMISCQEAVNAGRAGGPPAGDPFATPTTPVTDPFATPEQAAPETPTAPKTPSRVPRAGVSGAKNISQ